MFLNLLAIVSDAAFYFLHLFPSESDYRGFGDSSPVALNESTVVSDARTALAWITDKLGDKAKVRFS
jgi:hypothetical protein